MGEKSEKSEKKYKKVEKKGFDWNWVKIELDGYKLHIN